MWFLGLGQILWVLEAQKLLRESGLWGFSRDYGVKALGYGCGIQRRRWVFGAGLEGFFEDVQ